MPRNRYYEGPPSDHFDGTRFFNPGQPSTDRASLRCCAGSSLAARRHGRDPCRSRAPGGEAGVAGLRVTMIGHASLLIQAAGMNILTDPVWSERASPFPFAGPKRVTAPGIAFEHLPPIDVLLLSHCHYDHLDIATLRRLQAAHAPLMAMPLGNDAIVRAAVPDACCLAGDWWDRLPIGDDVVSTLTPASSGRTAGRPMCGWRCGRGISSQPLPARSGSPPTPATAMARSSDKCASVSVHPTWR